MIQGPRQDGQRPSVLVAAGSDSAGLAGLPMDIRCLSALGVHASVAVTACTVQDSRGVSALNPLPAQAFSAQLEAAAESGARLLKAGMLASGEQVEALSRFLSSHQRLLVYDPVFQSSSGHPLSGHDLPMAVKRHLLPYCSLLTPNLDEAGRLTGIKGTDPEATIEMAESLIAMGAKAVLLKGGHRQGEFSSDFFKSQDRAFWLSSPRLAPYSPRGTGCALSSAIAGALALGHRLEDAVVIGKMAINQGIRQAYASGGGQPSVNITGFPCGPEDLPLLHQPGDSVPGSPAFPSCGPEPLGLYPIVPGADWIRRLAPLGIKVIQLRIKDLAGQALREEIRQAVTLCKRHRCRLFVNDHWRMAIEEGAYGVHLGQEDLVAADLNAIRAAGLRLGISTHCHYEVAAAHRWRPSYIAFGPVYHTDTKKMPWTPLGPKGLAYWRQVLPDYPLVAIGGIKQARLAEVKAAGVDAVAMITAITDAPDPKSSVLQLQNSWTQASSMPRFPESVG